VTFEYADWPREGEDETMGQVGTSDYNIGPTNQPIGEKARQI